MRKNKKQLNNWHVILTADMQLQKTKVVLIKGTMLPPCGDEHNSIGRLHQLPHFRRLNASRGTTNALDSMWSCGEAQFCSSHSCSGSLPIKQFISLLRAQSTQKEMQIEYGCKSKCKQLESLWLFPAVTQQHHSLFSVNLESPFDRHAVSVWLWLVLSLLCHNFSAVFRQNVIKKYACIKKVRCSTTTRTQCAEKRIQA